MGTSKPAISLTEKEVELLDKLYKLFYWALVTLL